MTPQNDAQIAELQSRLDSIEALLRTHQHNGGNATRINLNTDLFGLFEVVSTAPTAVPRDLYDQIKIYTNSTTYRLYWYDWTNHAWRYATGT